MWPVSRPSWLAWFAAITLTHWDTSSTWPDLRPKKSFSVANARRGGAGPTVGRRQAESTLLGECHQSTAVTLDPPCQLQLKQHGADHRGR